MDDPWGSPWASTDKSSENDPPPLPSPANAFLSPPPRAFFGSTTSLSAQPPWSGVHDDSGGFGVWATADRADGTDNQSDWETWAETGLQAPRLSPRLSVSSKEGPLAWPENAASPVLKSSSRSRTPSIFRHHSPDPWAAELSLNNKSEIEPPSPLAETASGAPNLESQSDQILPCIYQSFVSDSVEGKVDDGESPTEETPTSKDAKVASENDARITSTDVVDDRADKSSKSGIDVHKPPSRSSSTFSLDSHNEPERQDSPITSIDEERGARLQYNSRKPSGKVQELVGIYDGLTRAVSEEPPTSEQYRISGMNGREFIRDRQETEDDKQCDYGDFEDARPPSERVVRSSSLSALSSASSSTPKAELKDDFSGEHVQNIEVGMPVFKTAPVRIQDLVDKFGDINFDTNSALIEKLFPELHHSFDDTSAESWEAPDHIISDSFTTISERKAWYRISRYGSMRKHNSGDDENYHRVAWSNSQLHSDTIKIVRRWMEEDSYSGRAVLGGTKRTGFFDWDSDAAPMELDKVFQRSTSTANHARTASIPIRRAIDQPVSTDSRPYRNSTGISLATELRLSSSLSTPAAGFTRGSEAKQAALANRLPHTSNKDLNTPKPSTYSTHMPALAPRPAPVQTTSVDEDEDEWGEMISSPRVEGTDNRANASPFTISQGPVENHQPLPQLSPSMSKTLEVTELGQPNPPEAQPLDSDSWQLDDFSVHEKPPQTLGSPTRQSSRVSADFSGFESNTPIPGQESVDLLSPKSTIKSRTLNENNATSQGTVERAPNARAQPKAAVAVPNPVKELRDANEDNIVQTILQNLPDLSYML
ncbi:hypothetical protein F5Y19DRAFT_58079 [Xylariaceae sp. FL1651]|nr:hypothetical protein F5Y19DRAFT_58079 [Xylariaceae sp. FL1651]